MNKSVLFSEMIGYIKSGRLWEAVKLVEKDGMRSHIKMKIRASRRKYRNNEISKDEHFKNLTEISQEVLRSVHERTVDMFTMEEVKDTYRRSNKAIHDKINSFLKQKMETEKRHEALVLKMEEDELELSNLALSVRNSIHEYEIDSIVQTISKAEQALGDGTPSYKNLKEAWVLCKSEGCRDEEIDNMIAERLSNNKIKNNIAKMIEDQICFLQHKVDAKRADPLVGFNIDFKKIDYNEV